MPKTKKVVKNRAKRNVKTAPREMVLQEAFIKSLDALEEYWQKQVEKTQVKKPSKASKGKKSLPEDNNNLKAAKDTLAKYQALRRLIENFEKNWPQKKELAKSTVQEDLNDAMSQDFEEDYDRVLEQDEQELDEELFLSEDAEELEFREDFSPELLDDEYDEYSDR